MIDNAVEIHQKLQQSISDEEVIAPVLFKCFLQRNSFLCHNLHFISSLACKNNQCNYRESTYT